MAVRPIDAVQVLHDINLHRRPTPVSEFESGFNNGLNQAMWEITHAPTPTQPNEWVSVEERLPEPTYCVLVYTTDYSIEVDALDSDGEWMSFEVTHWMPLPKSPKEDE